MAFAIQAAGRVKSITWIGLWSSVLTLIAIKLDLTWFFVYKYQKWQHKLPVSFIFMATASPRPPPLFSHPSRRLKPCRCFYQNYYYLLSALFIELHANVNLQPCIISKLKNFPQKNADDTLSTSRNPSIFLNF